MSFDTDKIRLNATKALIICGVFSNRFSFFTFTPSCSNRVHIVATALMSPLGRRDRRVFHSKRLITIGKFISDVSFANSNFAANPDKINRMQIRRAS
jgi:hypothetical protein